MNSIDNVRDELERVGLAQLKIRGNSTKCRSKEKSQVAQFSFTNTMQDTESKNYCREEGFARYCMFTYCQNAKSYCMAKQKITYKYNYNYILHIERTRKLIAWQSKKEEIGSIGDQRELDNLCVTAREKSQVDVSIVGVMLFVDKALLRHITLQQIALYYIT